MFRDACVAVDAIVGNFVVDVLMFLLIMNVIVVPIIVVVAACSLTHVT